MNFTIKELKKDESYFQNITGMAAAMKGHVTRGPLELHSVRFPLARAPSNTVTSAL
jgi:hypothetical protein